MYVIGYRLHILTAIDARTGHRFPLISLLAPANHHDRHFLPFLVHRAQAMGIELQLITADEAYHDKDGSLFQKTGVIVTTPPSSTVSVPEHVDPDSGSVYCNAECSIPMVHLSVAEEIHEYKCDVHSEICQFSTTCPRCRFIPVDKGLFPRIPWHIGSLKQAHGIRKNCERPFNLLKNQTGPETVRVRSQQATIARCTFASIAVLLIKMAGMRRKQTPDNPQQMSLQQVQKAAYS